MNAVRIRFKAGSGGLFDRIRWRCTGTGPGCGVWMAAAWDWAPALAAEHVATCHAGVRVYGLEGSSPGPGSGLVDLMGAEL